MKEFVINAYEVILPQLNYNIPQKFETRTLHSLHRYSDAGVRVTTHLQRIYTYNMQTRVTTHLQRIHTICKRTPSK